MSNKKIQRSARKNAKGINLRNKLGLPSKAGKRKAPATKGAHITSEWDRKRGMWLSTIGVAFYERSQQLRGHGETS